MDVATETDKLSTCVKMSKKGKGKAEKAAPEGGNGLMGNFVNDFPIHCQQQGLPAVTVRSLSRPGAPPTGTTATTPNVLVEEDPGTGSLLAIHLRNLLLEERLLTALASSLEGVQLAAIVLWNVGLNEDTTAKLVSLVASSAVRRLALDGNQVSAHHVVSLFQTSIEHLSLKCCCLGDKFCEVIGPALTSNTSLLSLDLSSNQITDEGVSHLAGGLRQNRSLLSLCLAGNRIGDSGVNALCKVLMKFPLTKEEENLRKSLLTTVTPEIPISSSGRSSSGASVDKSGRGGVKGKKKEETGKGSSGGKGGRGAKTGGKKGGKLEAGGDDPPTQPQVGVAGGSGQPLLDLVTEEDGQLWMSGNSCLAHLTLSCNCVGLGGVASLLGVLRAQQSTTLLPVTSDFSGSERTAEQTGTGLLRITLEHNCIPADCDDMKEITSLIRSRDPMTTPTTPPPQIIN